jgi:hypothetical protein
LAAVLAGDTAPVDRPVSSPLTKSPLNDVEGLIGDKVMRRRLTRSAVLGELDVNLGPGRRPGVAGSERNTALIYSGPTAQEPWAVEAGGSRARSLDQLLRSPHDREAELTQQCRSSAKSSGVGRRWSARVSAKPTICAALRQPEPACDGLGRLRSKRSRVRVAPGPFRNLFPRFDFSWSRGLISCPCPAVSKFPASRAASVTAVRTSIDLVIRLSGPRLQVSAA